MAGYTRNDTGNNIADGNVINAADLDGEFDSIQTAFNETSGHTHDGTVGEGAPISVVGPAQDINVTITEVVPKTTNTMSLGTAALQFKDLYIDGTANIDSLVADTADINAGTIDGTTIGASTPAAITGTSITATGNIAVAGTVDGRDVATDGTKLDTIETNADVTDTANVTAAGALMDSELTNITAVKALDQGVATTDSPSFAGLTATTADINGGTIDGATIATSDITVGAGKTLDVSAGTLTLANDQISGDKIQGGTIGSTTITTLTGTTANVTDVNATTVDTTNIEVTNIKAKDGTAAATIADTTGVVTIPSAILTTADINGGTIDNATIATSDVTVGAGKTLDVSAGTLTLADDQISGDKIQGGTIGSTTITTLTGTTGNITNVNATTVDTTNIEATNIKAKDGTASATIADATGVMTVASSVLTTTDINGGTIDGVTIGGAVAGAGTFTSVTGTSLDMNGAAVFNESGADVDFRIESDTNTHAFFLHGSDGNVGIGTSSPATKLDVRGNIIVGTSSTEGGQIDLRNPDGTSTGGTIDVAAANAMRIFQTANNSVLDIGQLVGTGGTIRLHTGATERMRITAAGNVGIGTSSPQALLDVTGASGNQLVVGTNASATSTEAGILFKHATTGQNFEGGGVRSVRNGTNNDFGLALDIGEDAVSTIGMFISGGENTRGYVGIRTGSTPQTQLHVDAGTKNYTGTAPGLTSYAVTIESGSTGTCGIGIGSHNNTPSIQGFGTGTSYNVALCPANGKVAIGHTNPSQALDVVGSIEVSGGVYLGGTAAANNLDDYEEGTWTPAFTPATGAFGSIGYLYSYGSYTKVGRLVTVVGRIQADGTTITIGTAGGRLQISGLPFTTAADPFVSTVSFATIEGWSNNLAPSSAYVNPSATYVSLNKRAASNTNETAMTAAELVSAGTFSGLMFSAIYYTA